MTIDIDRLLALADARDARSRLAVADGGNGDGVERIRLKIELLTPLFGGGLDIGRVHLQHPVRGKGVRHQLRMWWRLLAEAGVLPGQSERWDRSRVRLEEARRFGGDDEAGKPHKPRVRVRIEDKPVDEHSLREWKDGNDPLRVPDYVYGLLNENAKEHRLAKAGLRFTLIVECAGAGLAQLRRELELAIRWWLSFGGIGGRQARGCGRVGPACVKDLAAWPLVDKKEAERAGFDLRIKAHRRWRVAGQAWKFVVAVYRSFRQGHEARAVNGFMRLGRPQLPEAEILADLARQYRKFCAGVPLDNVVRPLGKVEWQADGNPKPYKPGRSTHPMAEALRVAMCENWPGDSRPGAPAPQRTAARGFFSNAAFGLPIVGTRLMSAYLPSYPNLESFKVYPSNRKRHASPLRIGVRRVGRDDAGNDRWESWMLLLPQRFREAALDLDVLVEWRTPAGLPGKNLGPFSVWDRAHGEDVAADVPAIAILGKGATDPLVAVLNYFDSCSPA